MRRSLSLLSSFSAFAFAACAHAVVWADDTTSAATLAFGNQARFRGVGLVDVGDSYGTGTFIGYGGGSAWMITANHVLGLGQTASFVLPDYGSYTVTGAFTYEDITVARLSASFNIQGLYAPSLNLSAITAGQNVVSAGFGLACAQSDAYYYNEDPTRRGFQSVSLGAQTFSDGTFVLDRFDAPGDANKRTIEGFGAPGDSGSAFVRESDGAILGVLTGGDPEFYGGMNYYSALTPAVSRSIYSFTGINPVPEPATIAALGFGALALLRRRRRA